MLNENNITVILNIFKNKISILYIYKMNPTALELETLQTIRNELIKQIDFIDNRIKILQNNTEFKCNDCNMVFKNQIELDKHLVSKKHNDKIGVSPTKCSQCNNKFYGNDLVAHVEDGRCAKSRTCNGCRVTFSNMMNKSRHTCSKQYLDTADNTQNIIKKKKLKIKTKTKPPSPLPPLIPPSPPPSPIKPKESMFTIDPIKYKLKPLPDSCDNITPQWYENLHYSMNKNDVYFENMESESSIIDNSYEEFPMYSKKDIIYYKEDDTKAFKLDFNGGKYYKLITLYEDPNAVEEKKEEIIENLECLTTLGENNMCAEIYQNLHKHHTLGQPDFLPDEFHRKFNNNIADIRDCAYQAGEYLHYDHDGHLCRGDEKLFRFFKHPSGLIYDIEACETNECDLTTEDEIEMMEEFENEE